ncbi:MAG: VOC family protein [Myxococcota bacterium]|nr:VOC family protein [Myxococcales bacterium]
MGYHHLALAARDIRAIHAFYEGVMEFELVKVEIGPAPEGGWAKHFFYRMDDDSKLVAFWELHDIPGTEGFETDIAKAAGVPAHINHIAFDVADRADLDRRRKQWLEAGLEVLEIDHDWCHSIYTRDPNGNLVEFCLTTGAFTPADRERALAALASDDLPHSKPPARIQVHAAR